MARRSAPTWFVTVLNGPAARRLRIDLGFLRKGRYDALVVRDRLDDGAAVMVEKSSVTSGAALAIELRASGGFIARLTPR